MKLLVTGGAGFIGSAVVRLAVARGHQVVNLDALTYAACLDNVASVAGSELYRFEQADIRDRAALDRVFAAHSPDAVMHLAAESHVDRSIDGPADFIETNITGTFNMLEAARAYWQRAGRPAAFRFHHISTDEVFGSLGPEGQFTETTPYDPRSPYSASKAASDHLVRAWHETYGVPVVLSNCSNNYGPFHFPEKLIPVVILNALAGKPIPVYGQGLNVRDWLYVEDHADALLLVVEKGAAITLAARTSGAILIWCARSAPFWMKSGQSRGLMPTRSALFPIGRGMTPAMRLTRRGFGKSWDGGHR